MDAGNLLKPMLARGELHCIGATTLDEYRKHIEKDAALERRFQPVLVDQPSVEDTISILRGLRERYEVHHGVRIKDAALVAAAVLLEPLHHRPLSAGQGDRPDGRSGGEAAHRDRFHAGGAGRDAAPHHAARDRARGAAQGEGHGVEGAAGQAGKGTGRSEGRVGRAEGALAGGEGGRAAAARSCASRSSRPRSRSSRPSGSTT